MTSLHLFAKKGNPVKALHLFSILLLIMAVVITGCPTGTTTAKEKIYDIKGKVLSVDAKGKSLKLDHDEIPGYMSAMKMSFDVADPKLVGGIKEGDQVQGKLKVRSGERDVITEL